MMEDRVIETVRGVLDGHARLEVAAAALAPDQDLYACGMTSLARVEVMLALEAAFDVEFPNHLLRHTVFGSIRSIADAVVELTQR